MGVVVRRYIDILTIIINFPYSTCISSFFGSSIPTPLFIFKMFFRSCIHVNYLERIPVASVYYLIMKYSYIFIMLVLFRYV